MRYVSVLGVVLITALVCSAQLSGFPTNVTPYDDFSARFLNPTKWSPSAACEFASANLLLECVREIQHKKLRLAMRSLGARDMNSGFQFGANQLVFANSSSITAIRADLIFRKISGIDCPDNSDGFAAVMGISGNFFNTGGGVPNEDAGAAVILARSSSDPPGQIGVMGQLHWNWTYPTFWLGTARMGTPLRAVLKWDQPNHQFLVTVTDLDSGAVLKGTMPYVFSDVAAATNPNKNFEIDTYAPNCVARQTAVGIDTLFDNVFINSW